MAVTVADVEDYLGATSWTTADITDALAVETAAQAAVCAVPAPMPADLAHALKRRVARNLALRSNHLGVGSMDGDGPAIAPGRDQEVRRYEAPYRRLVVG